MKNCFVKFLLGFLLIFSIYFNVKAVSRETTHPLPGEECSKIWTLMSGMKLYKCEVDSEFNSILASFKEIIKWFVVIVSLAGALFIVVNWIMLAMGGLDSGVKEKAKTNIIRTLGGIVLLFSSWYILHVIAPWVYK